MICDKCNEPGGASLNLIMFCAAGVVRKKWGENKW